MNNKGVYLVLVTLPNNKGQFEMIRTLPGERMVAIVNTLSRWALSHFEGRATYLRALYLGEQIPGSQADLLWRDDRPDQDYTEVFFKLWLETKPDSGSFELMLVDGTKNAISPLSLLSPHKSTLGNN